MGEKNWTLREDTRSRARMISAAVLLVSFFWLAFMASYKYHACLCETSCIIRFFRKDTDKNKAGAAETEQTDDRPEHAKFQSMKSWSIPFKIKVMVIELAAELVGTMKKGEMWIEIAKQVNRRFQTDFKHHKVENEVENVQLCTKRQRCEH